MLINASNPSQMKKLYNKIRECNSCRIFEDSEGSFYTAFIDPDNVELILEKEINENFRVEQLIFNSNGYQIEQIFTTVEI